MNSHFYDRLSNTSLRCIFFIFTACLFGNQLLAFPVLYGDEFSLTIQFQGGSIQTFTPVNKWGVGDSSSFTDFSVTPTETVIGKPGTAFLVNTYSSRIASGIDINNNGFKVAALLSCFLLHQTATYADITISGLDGWKDYPNMTNLAGYLIDPASVRSKAALSNISITNTSISFRSPLYPVMGTPLENSLTIGFSAIIPEPATLLLLGLGGMMLRRKK